MSLRYSIYRNGQVFASYAYGSRDFAIEHMKVLRTYRKNLGYEVHGGSFVDFIATKDGRTFSYVLKEEDSND